MPEVHFTGPTIKLAFHRFHPQSGSRMPPTYLLAGSSKKIHSCSTVNSIDWKAENQAQFQAPLEPSAGEKQSRLWHSQQLEAQRDSQGSTGCEGLGRSAAGKPKADSPKGAAKASHHCLHQEPTGKQALSRNKTDCPQACEQHSLKLKST